jgi:hypothetical protein
MADPGTWTAIGAIGSIVGSLFGIGESLFGGSSIKMPKLQMPQVQNFKIPQTDLQQLNQQIAQNTQLSDQARQAAMQAINGYNQGQLSGAYAGMYQDQYNKAKQQILQQLAAQGFTQGSTQYTNAMQNLDTWAANLKSQLLQKQLDDGMRLAGLSDKAIENLESSWQTQSGINAQNNAANIEGTNVYNQSQLGLTQAQMLNQQLQQQKYGNTMGAFKQLGDSLKTIGGGGTGSITSTGDIGGQYSSNPFGYQTPQSNPMGAAGLPTFGDIFGGQKNG